MVGRKLVRLLAPVVLVATAIGTYLIVAQHVHTSASGVAHHRVGGPRATGPYAHASFYTVQPGESLTSISEKTGLPINTLEALNPLLDPNSLQTGQRLRLRR